jgi:PAS domain-containing protein
MEERVRRADGQYRWFAVDRVAARDENGKIIKWYGTAYDVEDRHRAEDALRESEAKFRDYAETASDWFWEINPDYKFTHLSEHAFGSRAADRIGTGCWDHALDVEQNRRSGGLSGQRLMPVNRFVISYIARWTAAALQCT